MFEGHSLPIRKQDSSKSCGSVSLEEGKDSIT